MGIDDFFATSPEAYSFIESRGFDDFSRKHAMRAISPGMEMDLRSCRWLSDKCKASETYSQNLYAALCNNRFEKSEIIDGISWRMAGDLVAHLCERGDYINWYCSGLSGFDDFVPEGVITEEVRSDLERLGWKTLS